MVEKSQRQLGSSLTRQIGRIDLSVQPKAITPVQIPYIDYNSN